MKTYMKLILLLLLSVLTITSCKKDEKINPAEKNSKIIPNDPIASIVIDKHGTAIIKTKSGKEIKQSVLTKSELGILNDTITNKSPITLTFRLPIKLDNVSSFNTSSSSSIEVPNSYFTFTLTRFSASYVSISVWPAIMPVDDYVVRATPFITRHTNPVLWEINYVYTRNGSAFYSTQVQMSTWL